MNKIYWLIVVVLKLAAVVESKDYVFVPEDEDIFIACDNDKNDIHTMLDLSELKRSYANDQVHIEGLAKVIWDVTPSHRILVKGDIFRFKKGVWEPTAFSMQRSDFCRVFSKNDEIWYDSFVKFIPENQQLCFNNNGHVYNVEPFDLNMQFKNFQGSDMSGHYKIVIRLEAINEEGERDASVCFQIKGDLNKA